LSSRAAKNFGIASKSTAFFAAAQRKFWNLPTEATQTILFCRAAKIFGICQQKHLQLKLTAFGSVAQRNFLELRPKAVYFVQPRICAMLWTHTCLQPRAKNPGILTHATQID
jgi:hypothetical protein